VLKTPECCASEADTTLHLSANTTTATIAKDQSLEDLTHSPEQLREGTIASTP
jgi:hypothetical protein